MVCGGFPVLPRATILARLINYLSVRAVRKSARKSLDHIVAPTRPDRPRLFERESSRIHRRPDRLAQRGKALSRKRLAKNQKAGLHLSHGNGAPARLAELRQSRAYRRVGLELLRPRVLNTGPPANMTGDTLTRRSSGFSTKTCGPENCYGTLSVWLGSSSLRPSKRRKSRPAEHSVAPWASAASAASVTSVSRVNPGPGSSNPAALFQGI